jgi:glutaredoxin
MAPSVKVFALSTCILCKQAKQFLDDKAWRTLHACGTPDRDDQAGIEGVRK